MIKQYRLLFHKKKKPALSVADLQVLLVDDNPVNMVLNHKLMKSLIAEVHLTEAVNGLEALEHCKIREFS